MKSFIAIWLICGILAYGITFAHYQRKYPTLAKEEYREDFGRAVFFGFWGPVGLFSSLISSGFAKYGVKFK